MYRRLGYFPTESSEHSAEYVPWFLRHDEEIERLRIPVGDYVRLSEENLAEYAAASARASRRASRFEIERSLEYAPQIIHSMETGQPRVDLRQRPQQRPDHNLPPAAASRCRAWSTAPACSRPHVGRCRRSAPRSTAPS